MPRFGTPAGRLRRSVGRSARPLADPTQRPSTGPDG